MRTCCLNDISALQSYAEVWNRMAAGVPFRSWEWLSTWWRHYGPSAGLSAGLSAGRADRTRQLQVLCVLDEAGVPAGFAPFYSEDSAASGRVLRLLGDGEVCSEYLGVLAVAGREEAVALAIADHLADRFHVPRSSPDRWDLLLLEAVADDDPVLRPMLAQLRQLGGAVHCRPGPGCWRIELPGSWEEMCARLSKNQRRQVRRLLQANERRGVVLHKVERLSELPEAFEHLIDLHQRRWQARGRSGCFASDRFLAFHRDVTPQLLRAGQLQLLWLEAEGTPLAAEYQMAGAGTIYLYQAGLDPDRLKWEPGHLATARVLQLAIAQGCRRFDFLRGNEPYKAQWQAEFHGNTSVRVIAPRVVARARHQAWLAVRTAKDWVRRGLKPHNP